MESTYRSNSRRVSEDVEISGKFGVFYTSKFKNFFPVFSIDR